MRMTHCALQALLSETAHAGIRSHFKDLLFTEHVPLTSGDLLL